MYENDLLDFRAFLTCGVVSEAKMASNADSTALVVVTNVRSHKSKVPF